MPDINMSDMSDINAFSFKNKAKKKKSALSNVL